MLLLPPVYLSSLSLWRWWAFWVIGCKFKLFTPLWFLSFFLSRLPAVFSGFSSVLPLPRLSLFPCDRQQWQWPWALHGASPTRRPRTAPSPDAVHQEGAPVALQGLQKRKKAISMLRSDSSIHPFLLFIVCEHFCTGHDRTEEQLSVDWLIMK